MANPPQPEKEFWLVSFLRLPGKHWWWIAAGSLLLLAVASYFLQDAFPASGNVASILGLFISAVGFIATIWTVLETQRIEREAKAQLQQSIAEAQEKIEAARQESRRQLNEARQETREILDRVRRTLVLTDSGEAYYLAKTVRTLTRRRQWEFAHEMCEGMRRLCLNLLHSGTVPASIQEKLEQALQQLAPVLALLSRYEKEKPTVGELIGQEAQWDPLERILFLLEAITARNRAQVLETPHAEPPRNQ